MLTRRSQMTRTRFVPKPLVRDSRRWLKNELDVEISRIVRARGKCCVIIGCGSTYQLECGHFYTRSILIIRWDMTNCNAQCHFHNQLHIDNGFPYLQYMLSHYGAEALSKLSDLRALKYKPTNDDLRIMLNQYRSM